MTRAAFSRSSKQAPAARWQVEKPRDVPVSRISRLCVLTTSEYSKSATRSDDAGGVLAIVEAGARGEMAGGEAARRSRFQDQPAVRIDDQRIQQVGDPIG